MLPDPDSNEHLERLLLPVAPLEHLERKRKRRRGASAAAWRRLRLAWRNMATHDVIILTFHALLWLRVSAAPAGELKATAWLVASGLLLLTCATLLLCRGELLPAGRARSVSYRVLIIACVLLSYFEMRLVLPALQPVLVDAELLAIDEALLGATPAVWLERFITPASTQWFSFFYYSYIWLLVLNLAGTAALDRDALRRHEMLLGGTIVAVAGHLLYTVVPGVGPYAHISFATELPQVFWWRQVGAVVDSAGAVLDIFPSLHTAFPAFFALHALRHRRALPFAVVWPGALFFSLNIIVATLFLRWHYAVDVAAGLALAAAAQQVAIRVARRERSRAAAGLQPVFED